MLQDKGKSLTRLTLKLPLPYWAYCLYPACAEALGQASTPADVVLNILARKGEPERPALILKAADLASRASRPLYPLRQPRRSSERSFSSFWAKIHGMKADVDEIMAAAVKRSHKFHRSLGICSGPRSPTSKGAIKCQATLASCPRRADPMRLGAKSLCSSGNICHADAP